MRELQDPVVSYPQNVPDIFLKSEKPSPTVFSKSHRHMYYEIILVAGGCIHCISKDDEQTLVPGDIYLVPPFQYHHILPEGEEDYERITILFGEDLIPDRILTYFSSVTHCTAIHMDERMQEIAAQMRLYYGRDSGKYDELLRALYVQLLYSLAESDRLLRQAEPSQSDTVHQVIDYISANIQKKITLDEIAKATLLSTSTLCHLFKEKMKISVKQYILQEKIAFASRMIADGCPATEAAKHIGYTNYANFYHAYLKVNGFRPSEKKGPPPHG